MDAVAGPALPPALVRPTWMWAGVGVTASVILATVPADPARAAGGFGAADVVRIVAAIPLCAAFILLAFGRDSIVRRRPLGMTALLVLAAWPFVVEVVALTLPAQTLTAQDENLTAGAWAVMQVVPTAFALVAVMQVWRADAVPRPVRWVPAAALALCVLPPIVQYILLTATRVSSWLGAVMMVAAVCSALANLAIGVAAVVCSVWGAPGADAAAVVADASASAGDVAVRGVRRAWVWAGILMVAGAAPMLVPLGGAAAPVVAFPLVGMAATAVGYVLLAFGPESIVAHRRLGVAALLVLGVFPLAYGAFWLVTPGQMLDGVGSSGPVAVLVTLLLYGAQAVTTVAGAVAVVAVLRADVIPRRLRRVPFIAWVLVAAPVLGQLIMGALVRDTPAELIQAGVIITALCTVTAAVGLGVATVVAGMLPHRIRANPAFVRHSRPQTPSQRPPGLSPGTAKVTGR